MKGCHGNRSPHCDSFTKANGKYRNTLITERNVVYFYQCILLMLARLSCSRLVPSFISTTSRPVSHYRRAANSVFFTSGSAGVELARPHRSVWSGLDRLSTPLCCGREVSPSSRHDGGIYPVSVDIFHIGGYVVDVRYREVSVFVLGWVGFNIINMANARPDILTGKA